jgi:hypothetical protein
MKKNVAAGFNRMPAQPLETEPKEGLVKYRNEV